MSGHRFNVFGRIVALKHHGDSWKTYLVGNDGKRDSGEFIVPGFVAEHELQQYLEDLLHETATPWNGNVSKPG